MRKKYWFVIVLIATVIAWWFSLVFSGQIILSQSFNLGFLNIKYYGLAIAVSILAAYFLALHRRSPYELSEQQADKIILSAIFGGFIGARLYHVLSDPLYYKLHPAEILMVWHGGLSIYGAIAGGVLAAWFAIKNKKAFISALNWLAPSVVLGQIIGRLGNFFNYELFGYPTSLPWKMFVPENFRGFEYRNFSFFHPLFLYEILASCFLLWLLLILAKNPKHSGRLFLWYLFLYNIVRFFLEFLRIDAEFIGHLRQNALISLMLVIASGIVIFYVRTRKIPQN